MGNTTADIGFSRLLSGQVVQGAKADHVFGNLKTTTDKQNTIVNKE